MRESTIVDGPYVFIKSPSFDELESGLRKRNTPGLYGLVMMNETLAVS